MNFLKRLKSRLDRREGGHHREVVIDRRDLYELIEQFERIDSEFRQLHDKGELERELANCAMAVFRKHGNSFDHVQLIVSNSVNPLIEEEVKTRERKLIMKSY